MRVCIARSPKSLTPIPSLTILAFALLAGCCSTAPPHVCTEIIQRTFAVERIVDGDTFKVVYDGEMTSVRFVGINAPERNDPAGPAATKALTSLIGGRTVRLQFPQTGKRDNFGRLLCRVFIGDVNVGKWMLENGHATRYVPRR